MDNVRNLGYVSNVSGNIEVAKKADKQDPLDRTARRRAGSVFDINFSSTEVNSVLARTRPPIKSDYTPSARRPVSNHRATSS